MLYSYSELVEMKEKGIKLDWDSISEKQLERLFFEDHIPNNMIAELYDVSPSKVRTKRNKWDITFSSAKYLYKKYTEENSELFKILNNGSKERLLKEENIDWLSKALTHYVFRNGPVEDIHANGQLSQDDMKTLNKYMVNRIAGLLKLVHDGEWLKIELVLNFLKIYGTDWDKAEYDFKDVDIIFKNAFEVAEEERDKIEV